MKGPLALPSAFRRGLARLGAWRARHPDWPLLAVVGVVMAATVVLEARLCLLFVRAESPVGFDDGYIAAFAARLIGGRWLPYVDAVSLRGPLLYWTSALYQAVFGRFDWTGQRMLVASFHLVSLSGVLVTGLAARRPLAAAIGGIVHVLTVSALMERGSAFGVHGESPATMYAALSVAAAACAACRTPAGSWRRFVGWGVAGFFAACAGLTKQTSLTIVGPLALWAFCLGPEPARGLRRLGSAGALLVGWGAVVLAVLARYAAAGALVPLWYWGYAYSRVHMAPFRDAHVAAEVQRLAADNGFAVVCFVLGVLPGLGALGALAARRSGRSFRARYAEGGLEITLVLLAALGLAGAVSQLRFWPHHFWPAIPWVALGIGLAVDQGLLRRSGRAVAAAVVLVPLVVGLGVLTESRRDVFRNELRVGVLHVAQGDPMCEPIEAHSAPGDRITIWGFDGDLYVTCRRQPATRYVFSLPVAGIVPPFWGAPNPAFVARGARAQMADEIASERPKLVLDMPARVGGMSLEQIPELAAAVHAGYCRLGTFDRGGRVATIWIRGDGQPCPPAVP